MNKQFLNALREKLKGGNTRSIHLNALPGRYATRLDAANLDHIVTGLANDFLNTLLTEASFEFKVSYDGIDLNELDDEGQKNLGLISKRLNSLYIENEDNYKEHGVKTFGFGFPLLIKRSRKDPKKIIKAPLLIWPLEITKSHKKINTWSILRNKSVTTNGKIQEDDIHTVSINEVLLSFTNGDEEITLPQINEEVLEDSLLNKEELMNICITILQHLNVNTTTLSTLSEKLDSGLNPIPAKQELEEQTTNLPWLYFGGVFGLFRNQKESIIGDLDGLIEKTEEFDFNLKVDNILGSPHSAIPTDPSQQSILNSLTDHPEKIIQGPPGTGKSQTLTALVINALANGLKCLIVCEKKTALDVIYANLVEHDPKLGSLATVIEDLSKDRNHLVNTVRDRLSQVGILMRSNSFAAKALYDKLDEKISLINSYHKNLDKKIFHGQNWTCLVGQYRKKTKHNESFGFLKYHLSHKNYSFHHDEQELPWLIEQINKAEKLYKTIQSKEQVLDLIQDQYLKEDTFLSFKLKLEEDLDNDIKKLDKLSKKAEKQLQHYHQWIDQHYTEFYNNVSTQGVELIRFANEHEIQFGETLFKNDLFTQLYIIIFSIIQEEAKTLKEKRKLLVTAAASLHSTHKEYNYFQGIQQPRKATNLKQYVAFAEEYANRLEEWYRNIEEVKSEYKHHLSSTAFHSYYAENLDSVQHLERDGLSVITQLNEKNLLKNKIEIPQSINELLSLLQETKSRLAEVENSITELRDYFDWKHFYFSLPAKEKKTIDALVQKNSEDWCADFEAWYYTWLLEKVADELHPLPKDDDEIIELSKLKEELSLSQTKQIILYWLGEQKTSVAQAEAKGIHPNRLYNKRGSKGTRRNSLRKIVATDFNLFSNFFPVLMVNPSVCGSILPLKEGLFDLVIFDEASQLRLEDTFPSLIRGKVKIVSGDSHQMPPSSYFQGGGAILTTGEPEEEDSNNDEEDEKYNKVDNLDLAESESLLEFAESKGYQESYLEVHYRSQHPYLIDFSNHAFYGKRLIPLPPKHAYTPIKFFDTAGIYDGQTNRIEARQVIQILRQYVKPKEDGKLPSVGVATFNINQRNFILEEISKERQQHEKFDELISKLGDDFFVKNLENIQGDERDIIIISTTYGRRKDGSFRQNFGPVQQKNGYKLLNVIVTRAKHQVFVCSSIPNDYIQQFPQLLEKSGNNGRGIFYAYLAYAKAVSNNNEAARTSILDNIYEHCESKSNTFVYNALGSESPFEEEVYHSLAEKIGQGRIVQQYKIGGFRIDMVILSKGSNKPVIALECDGAKYHSSNEAYAWDMFRQSHLEKQGFTFFRIWSTNWWQKPKKELDKLVEFIYEFDRNEVTPLQKEVPASLQEDIAATAEVTEKKKVIKTSTVTIKNNEGKILKVRFSELKNNKPIKAGQDKILTIYKASPLAVAILGKEEGETCKVGMLESYYEILEIN